MAIKRNDKGFTLLELVIAITILGIITVIGSSLYTTYVRKGRRIDAINTLLSISLAQERYRAKNLTYGTLAQVWGGVTTSSEGFYSLAISNVTGSSYTITATAQGNQASDATNGTACTPLVLAFSGGSVTKTPAVCWPT